ncbi:MAG TPA: BatD family protein [Thermoanaerobaculia bacterium]|nr:BatD family protein [Thermoanaerobaculia bacterium]
MSRILFVLALCLASLTAVAQLPNADVDVSALSVDKTTVVSGDRFTLTFRVRNNGTDPSREVNINISNSYGTRSWMAGSTAPAGWMCSPVYATCWTEALAPGSEAQLTMTLLAPTQVRPAASLTVTVHASSATDRVHTNNRREVVFTLQRSSRQANLTLTMNAPPNPVAKNTPVTVTFAAHNHGPDALSNIRMPILFQIFGRTPAVTYEGAGWTCAPHGAVTLCQRESLAPGTPAPLEVRFTTPDVDSSVHLEASVYADQAHSDDDPTAEQVAHTVYVGNASDWSRILLPLTMEDTPGANGSLWKTEITGLIESSEGLLMDPEGCGGREDPCSLPPVQRAFDVRDEDLIVSIGTAQFIYVKREQAHLLRVTTRVYDSARDTETAGAFVPSARDEDFSPNGFSLLGIPVAPQFRSTLRVYDYDGRNIPVLVSLYGDDDDEPFSTTTHSLHVESRFTLTTALLPGQPATAQIDLTRLIPAGTYERVRVAVRPLHPGSRVWGAVSITNNETHHVTVVTP